VGFRGILRTDSEPAGQPASLGTVPVVVRRAEVVVILVSERVRAATRFTDTFLLSLVVVGLGIEHGITSLSTKRSMETGKVRLVLGGCDRAGARDYAAFLGFFFLEPS
jgi:hypothetical protein